jgi:hypothetical protein
MRRLCRHETLIDYRKAPGQTDDALTLMEGDRCAVPGHFKSLMNNPPNRESAHIVHLFFYW